MGTSGRGSASPLCPIGRVRAKTLSYDASEALVFASKSKHDDNVPKRKTPKLGEQLGSVGELIAAQRRAAELTLRQLADLAGISNPYLSQIERGLRRPSAEVLQQLSKALRVSAETLYVRAGILDPTDHQVTTVAMAVLADPAISERQKRVLIDVYSSFVAEHAATAPAPVPQGAPDAHDRPEA